jgi:hypothetical protein
MSSPLLEQILLGDNSFDLIFRATGYLGILWLGFHDLSNRLRNCRLQLNRRLAYFDVRFLRLNREPTLLFAPKS